MARRWVEFHRDRLQPSYPDFGAWFRVTGITKSGIAHAHVTWFGCYLPHGWLVRNWGEFSGGDDQVWVDEVKGRTGAGVAKYLSRQFVEYLAGQEVRARWSCSRDWRTGTPQGGLGSRGAPPPARVPVLGDRALEFVRSEWYRGHTGPHKPIYEERGQLRSSLTISGILAALR